MISYSDLARACFDNDAILSEHDLASCLSHLNTTWEDVERIAEQRALRAVLIQRGEAQRIKDQAYAGKFSIEHLKEDELVVFSMYIALWTDGAIAALRAIYESIKGDHNA